ncbi:MAG: GlsB/YeaQ/YmgE family stress response membrane protein [Maritimibacter sp.]|nr:GlsB/YeaQ/YmgE family stress response membrane protein [Maritimibacter sp.]
MQFLLLIVIGAAAGFIATRAMKVEAGVLLTVAIGVVGAVVGAVLFRLLPLLTGFAALVVGAVVGAALLLWVWKRLFR